MELFGFRFRAMGGQNEIQLYAESRSTAEELARLAIAETERIENKYSAFLEDSVTSEIKRSAGFHSIEIDNETASLIDYAASCFYQSDRLFDITTGPLRRLWDFKQKLVPEENRIAAAKKLCGFEKIERHRRTRLYLDAPGMELDLGGICKEYAVDKVATLLSQHKVAHALINFGGDVRALGPHQDETPWSIGLAHPRKKGEVLRTVQLYSGALATSGDYERYFEIHGQRYCHIINPLTGHPVNCLQAVTVIADACLIAGTLSTIAMLVGESEADELLEDHPHLIVTRTGKVIDKLFLDHSEGANDAEHQVSNLISLIYV
jgi:thiamine biosynthesis lipoprotein